MLVKKATPKNIPYILELYKEGLKEIGCDNIAESMLLKKVVNSYHLAPCFLLFKEYQIVGMAGFTTVTESHSGKPYLADYMFYVKPEHRSLKSLGALVGAARDFSDEKGIPIRVELIIQGDQSTRERLLKIHGFKPYAVIGVYENE